MKQQTTSERLFCIFIFARSLLLFGCCLAKHFVHELHPRAFDLEIKSSTKTKGLACVNKQSHGTAREKSLHVKRKSERESGGQCNKYEL